MMNIGTSWKRFVNTMAFWVKVNQEIERELRVPPKK
jgi:hypothetical protein